MDGQAPSHRRDRRGRGSVLHDPRFSPDQRRGHAGGDDRLRDLRHARPKWPQRGAADPRLYQQPPPGRAQPRQRQQSRRLGRAGRPGQADRHQPGVCRRLEHAGVVVRLDQRGERQPEDRPALRPDFPNITIRDIVAAQKALLDSLGRHASHGRRRPVLWRLPGVSVGGRLSRFHGRDRAGQHRALGLGQHRQAARRGDRAARHRPGMERRALLPYRRLQDGADRDPPRDLAALRQRRGAEARAFPIRSSAPRRCAGTPPTGRRNGTPTR